MNFNLFVFVHELAPSRSTDRAAGNCMIACHCAGSESISLHCCNCNYRSFSNAPIDRQTDRPLLIASHLPSAQPKKFTINKVHASTHRNTCSAFNQKLTDYSITLFAHLSFSLFFFTISVLVVIFYSFSFPSLIFLFSFFF